MIQSLIWAALGTGFAFLMTVSGAATVFLFRKQVNEGLQKIYLGFASGIMIAASIWSLIIPAIEQAEASGGLPWVPAALGFLFGGLTGQYILSIVVTAVILVVVLFALTQLTKLRYPEKVH